EPPGHDRPDLDQCTESVGASFAVSPLVRLIEARLGEAGRTQISGKYAFSAMLRPPAFDVGIALVKPAECTPLLRLVAPEAIETDVPAGNPIEDGQDAADEAQSAPIDAG